MYGSSGIAFGSGSVVSDYGVHASEVNGIVTSGNFITRNTCSGNTTNWEIAVNNVCLVLSAAVSAAISGDSDGISPGSTNPNAHFTF